MDDLDRQQDFEWQLANAQRRVDSVHAECLAQSFEGTSSDRLASVRVTGTGQVLDITLCSGFGDMSRPTWMLADDIDAAANAIVKAVNAARLLAAEGARSCFNEEFSGTHSVLDDRR